MAEHVMCITANGGIPLLTRTKPGCTPLSFPVVGSLNGVHMFGMNRDVTLVNTFSPDHQIVWKMYEDSIVLIAVAPSLDRTPNNQHQRENTDPAVDIQKNSRNATSTISESHMLRLLDNVFHSLVLLTGLNELTNSRNIDHLKKDLRSCCKLVDTFLDFENPEKQDMSLLCGDLTHCVDVSLSPDASLLSEHLQAFVEAADSTYGCLLVNGKVLSATNKWWDLTGQELVLLARLINIVPTSVSACDLPVYLPHSSPNIPHRLLIFTLVSAVGNTVTGGVRACVLCGPRPTLAHVQNAYVERFWGSGMKTLQKCVRSDCVPNDVRATLPKDMLGFLLLNTGSCRCVSLTMPSSGDADGNEAGARRKQRKEVAKIDAAWVYRKLRDFYKLVVGTSFPFPETIEDSPVPPPDLSPHSGLAHYRCLTRCKCFALVRSQYQLFAVYSVTAPTFALQRLTERTLEILTKDNLI